MGSFIEVARERYYPEERCLKPFRGIQVVMVCDSYGKNAGMSGEIRPLQEEMTIFGVALTVESRPADNLVLYKAMELAVPGNVLVISTHRHQANAIWGDFTSTIAVKSGVTGMVTDGMVRDSEGIIRVGLPVFSAGVTPNSCYTTGSGRIGFPVAVGGLTVKTGDLVVGDKDGVVVIPFEQLEDCGAKITALKKKEVKMFEDYEHGQILPEAIREQLAKICLKEI